MFAIRIVNADYYNTAPVHGLDPFYSDFRGAEIKQVPVIRIFGITPAGQKTCLHLHGAFPYILIPYDGSQPVNRYMAQLATSLDKAINISFGNTNSTTQHVYKVTLESCIPFYGYHAGEHYFLKISFYSPLIVKRAVELLQNGAVMSKSFQPHEAHVPYILQVMIDYNLYGMNFILLKQFKFRRKKSETTDECLFVDTEKLPLNFTSDSNKSSMVDIENTSLSLKLWTLSTVSSDLFLPESVEAMSVCELEIDAEVQDIQNRTDLLDNKGINPGIAEIWKDECQRRKNLGRSSQITPSSSQERCPLPIISNELFYKQLIEEKIHDITANMALGISILEDSQTHEGSGIAVDLFCPENDSNNKNVVIDTTLESNNVENLLEAPPDDLDLFTNAIIDEEIIGSLSQNFSASGKTDTSVCLDSQDAEIIELIAKLGFSQNVSKPGDEDSIISSQPIYNADTEDEETLQMTQQIWDSDILQENSLNRLVKNLKNENEIKEIPQVDGPLDPKTNSSGGAKNDHYQIGTAGRIQLAEGTPADVGLSNQSCLNDQGISYVSMDQLSMATSANSSLLSAGFSTAPVYNTGQYGMMHDAWGYGNHPLWTSNNSGMIGMTGPGCYPQGFLDISLQPEWMTSSNHNTTSEAKDPYASYQQNVCNTHSSGINSLSLNSATANSSYFINSAQYNINQNHIAPETTRNMIETVHNVHDSAKYTAIPKTSSNSMTTPSYNTQNIHCAVSTQNYISLQHISSVAKNYLETWCDSNTEHSKLSNSNTCDLNDQPNAANIYASNSTVLSGIGKNLPYINNSQNQKASEIPLSPEKLIHKDSGATPAYNIYSKIPVNNNEVTSGPHLSSISRKDMAYLELGKYDRRESTDKRGSHCAVDGASNNSLTSLAIYNNNINESISLPSEISNSVSPKFSDTSESSDSVDNSDAEEESTGIDPVKGIDSQSTEDNQNKELFSSGNCIHNKDGLKNTEKLVSPKVMIHIQQKDGNKNHQTVGSNSLLSCPVDLKGSSNDDPKANVVPENNKEPSAVEKCEDQSNISEDNRRDNETQNCKESGDPFKEKNNLETNKMNIELSNCKTGEPKPENVNIISQKQDIQKIAANSKEKNICTVQHSVNVEELRLQKKSCVLSLESNAYNLNSKIEHQKHSRIPVLQKIASLIQKGNSENDEKDLNISTVPLRDFRQTAISSVHSVTEGLKDKKSEMKTDHKQHQVAVKKSVKFHPSIDKNKDSLLREKENHKRLLLKLASTKGESWMISSVQKSPSIIKSKSKNSTSHSRGIATSVLNGIRNTEYRKECNPPIISSESESLSRNPPAIPKIIFRKDVGINVSPKQLHPRTVGGYYMVKFHGQKVSVPQSVKLIDLLRLGKERILIKKLSENIINEFSNHLSINHSKAVSNKKRGRQSKVLHEQLTSCLQMREKESKLWKLHVSENIGLKICLKANNENNNHALKTSENRSKKANNDPTCSNTFSKLRKSRNSKVQNVGIKNQNSQTKSDKKSQNKDFACNEKFTKIKIKSVDDAKYNIAESSISECDTSKKPHIPSDVLDKQFDDVTRTVVTRARRSKVDYNPHAFSHLLNFDSLLLSGKTHKGQGRSSYQNKSESIPQNNSEFPRQQSSNASRGRGRNVVFKGCRMLKVKLKRLENSDLNLKFPEEKKSIVKENTSQKTRQIKLSLRALKKKISESESNQPENVLSPITNSSSLSDNNKNIANNICLRSKTSLHLNSAVLESANLSSSKPISHQKKSIQKIKNPEANENKEDVMVREHDITDKAQHSKIDDKPLSEPSVLPSVKKSLQKCSVIVDAVKENTHQSNFDQKINLMLKSNASNILEQSPKYKDAMWNLSFLSPPEKTKCSEISSPPKCWSPNETVEKDLDLSNSSVISDTSHGISKNVPSSGSYSRDAKLKSKSEKLVCTSTSSTENFYSENCTYNTERTISFPQVGISLIDDKWNSENKLSHSTCSHKLTKSDINKPSVLDQKSFIIRDPHFSDISEDDDSNTSPDKAKVPEKYETNNVNFSGNNFPDKIQDHQKPTESEYKKKEFVFEDDDVDDASEKSLSLYSTKSEVDCEEDEEGLGESLILSDLSGDESIDEICRSEISQNEFTKNKTLDEKITEVTDKKKCPENVETETSVSKLIPNAAKLDKDVIPNCNSENIKEDIPNFCNESSKVYTCDKTKIQIKSCESQPTTVENEQEKPSTSSDGQHLDINSDQLKNNQEKSKLGINRELQCNGAPTEIKVNKILAKDVTCDLFTDRNLSKSTPDYLESQSSEDIFSPCLTLLPPLIPIETGNWDGSFHSHDNSGTVNTLSSLKRSFSESDLICGKKFSLWETNLETSAGEIITDRSAVLLDFNKMHSSFSESVELNPLLKRNIASPEEVSSKLNPTKKTERASELKSLAVIDSKTQFDKNSSSYIEKSHVLSEIIPDDFQLTQRKAGITSNKIKGTRDNEISGGNSLSLTCQTDLKSKLTSATYKKINNMQKSSANAGNNVFCQNSNTKIFKKDEIHFNEKDITNSTSILDNQLNTDMELQSKKSQNILNKTVTLHSYLKLENDVSNLDISSEAAKNDKKIIEHSFEKENCSSSDEFIPGTPECDPSSKNHQNKNTDLKRVKHIKQLSLNKNKIHCNLSNDRRNSFEVFDEELVKIKNNPKKLIGQNPSEISSNYVNCQTDSLLRNDGSSSDAIKQSGVFSLENELKSSCEHLSADSEVIPCGQRSPSRSCCSDVSEKIYCSSESEPKTETETTQSKDEDLPATNANNNFYMKISDKDKIKSNDINNDIINTWGEIRSNQEAVSKKKSSENKQKDMKLDLDPQVLTDTVSNNDLSNSSLKSFNNINAVEKANNCSKLLNKIQSKAERKKKHMEISDIESDSLSICKTNKELLDSSVSKEGDCGIPEALFKIVDLINTQPVNEDFQMNTDHKSVETKVVPYASDNNKSITKDNVEFSDNLKGNINKKVKLSDCSGLASPIPSNSIQSFYDNSDASHLEVTSVVELDNSICNKKLPNSTLNNFEQKQKIKIRKSWKFQNHPPTQQDVIRKSSIYGIPQFIHMDLFYGSGKDAQEKTRIGKKPIQSWQKNKLTEFGGKYQENGIASWKAVLESTVYLQNKNNIKKNIRIKHVIVPAKIPPSFESVLRWIKQKTVCEVEWNGKCKERMDITDSKKSTENKITSVKDSGKTDIPSTMKTDQCVKNSEKVLSKNICESKEVTHNNINIVYIEKLHSTVGPLQREIFKKIFSPHDSSPKASRWDCNSRSPSPHHSTPSSCRAPLKSLPCTPIKRVSTPCEKQTEPKRRKLQLSKVIEESELEIEHCGKSLKRSRKNLEACGFDNEQKAKKQKIREIADIIDSDIIDSTTDESSLNKTQRFKEDVNSHKADKLSLKVPYHASHLSVCYSDIDGATPDNSHGYKLSLQNLQVAKSNIQCQHLTVMSMELHIRTREDLKPDPEFDPICAVFYHITFDKPSEDGKRNTITGAISVIPKNQDNDDSLSVCKCTCVSNPVEMEIEESLGNCSNSQKIPIHNSETKQSCDIENSTKKSCQFCRTSALKKQLFIKSGITDIEVSYVENETFLLETFVKVIRRWDPDILVGYEIQMLSWGYLIQRGDKLKMNVNSLISRIPNSSSTKNFSLESFDYMVEHTSEVIVVGRIVLNLWRLMRHEITLTGYTFENVVYHVLHQRIPLYSFRSLTQWFDHHSDLLRWQTIKHYIIRVKCNIDLLNQQDIVGRTSELSRLFGILFYEVLSRGSQFRVESMMLRMAKPLGYVAVSPSVQQRAKMRAPECLPLIMEPESKMYTNPVLVLDFQSLYPSMIIAYNYCFSTCLGRVDLLGSNDPFDFGCTSLKVPPSLLKKLQDDLNISPVGVAFVRPHVRKGVLPRMLEEILETRLMVKKAMKEHKKNKALHRILDARQLGLKLISNVTYGYTSANFSGRMPSVEVADSIVSKGRETLERAIRLVQETSKWKASVVYGDTDSLFVHLPGRTKEEAFRIGQEIAETVTAMNPKPVKLKFEKVYLPCILQTKKRYVGFMYETVDQKEPVFDAKGIETVRRDGCPAVAKILEKSIKLLFLSKDVSQVKQYVQRQFQKLLVGRVSLQDLTFAREYRGLSGYKPGACVPALEISKRLVRKDRRAEPRVGERVPHVIVYGCPGQPLFQLVRQPQEVLLDPNLHINAQYYINNAIIPPLQRVFNLIGVDVQTWYSELPRLARCSSYLRPLEDKKGTISQYFVQKNCHACGRETMQGLCNSCIENPQATVVLLNCRISQWERIHHNLCQICLSCTGSRNLELSCVSLDCPVFHRLIRTSQDLVQSSHLRNLCNKFFNL